MYKHYIRPLLLLTAALLLIVGFTALAEESAPLKTVQIPNSVTVVEKEAFANSGIEALVLTSGVEKIDSRAFADCKKLADVVMPKHDIEIADDAFEGCGDVYFHAFAGTRNELWALSHGFRCESIDGNVMEQTAALLKKFGIPSSGDLASGGDTLDFSTCCLIVKMNDARLPDISEYQPTNIIQAGRNRFFIQFKDWGNTEYCYNYLNENQEAFRVVYVEPDAYRSAVIKDDTVSQQAIVSGWSNPDPIGFEAYSAFVAAQKNGKSAVIAVLDSGFPSNAKYDAKLLKNKGINFTRDGNAWTYDGCNHGRMVAAVIADCVGDANVKILPVRISDGAGRIDTISLILGIEYAEQMGADIINMSLCFDDASLSSAALEETLNMAKATLVAAAGNFGGSCMTSFPANHSKVIAVSAVDEGYKLSSYSAYDAQYAAPGNVAGIGLNKTGTSFAAPQISAALALEMLDDSHTRSDLQGSCERVPQTSYGMPVLTKLARYSVGGIKINDAPATMLCDDFFMLTCTVVPENATDKTFTCESSDPSVLEVSTSSNGTILVKAVDKGTATLTVTSNDDHSVKDSVEIVVVKPVTAVTIHNGSSGTMYMNRALTLTASVEPADASNTAFTWKSSNEKVAKIDASGKVTPVAPGQVTFTAEASDKHGAYATYTLTIEERPPVSSIAITFGGSTESATIGVGSTIQLKATVEPADAIQDVVWKSLFPEYATIDQNGKVSAKAPGTAVISCESADGSKQAAWQLIVKEVAGSITLTAPKTEINQGEKLQITATVLPEDAIDKSVVWSSDNTAVATVSNTGLVTGVSNGQATIKATSGADSSVVAHMTVRVYGTFVVSFNANAPTGTPSLSTTSITALVDTALGTLPTPTLAHYNFEGWYLNAAGGGTQITASSTFPTNDPVTLYAKWVQKPESGWVTEASLPAGAMVTATSWSYREHTSSSSPSLSGWIANGSYWNETSSHAAHYATFPSGYDTSNKYYTGFMKAPYSAYENETSKRTVSNTWAGYIYWHWAYNVKYASVTTRTISSRKGSFNADGTAGGYAFKYFYAMASSVNCPYLDNGYCCNRYEKSYNCKSIINTLASSADKTNSTSGLHSNRFFRFDYYTSTYTDYQKVFNYYRDLSYQPNDPGTTNITDKVKYVKYIPQ